MENSTKVLQELKALKNKIEEYNKVVTSIADTLVLIDLGNEMQDESIVVEAKQSTKQIEKEIDRLEISNLLSGKHDANNAIVTIHPGAGGTEAQD